MASAASNPLSPVAAIAIATTQDPSTRSDRNRRSFAAACSNASTSDLLVAGTAQFTSAHIAWNSQTEMAFVAATECQLALFQDATTLEKSARTMSKASFAPAIAAARNTRTVATPSS